MSEELNKLAKAMRDMSDMVGDHHWLAAKAVEGLIRLRGEIAKRDVELEHLRAKTRITMGVGSGDGQLFIHGDYESVKAAQGIVIERDRLRAERAAIKAQYLELSALSPSSPLTIAAPVSDAKAQGEYGDAYQGAREDLAIWKRRALEAEEKVLQQEQIIDHLTSEAQGESRFGEPVVTPDAPCVPDGYVLADKKTLGTVLQALVNAPHHIRELQVTRQPVELFSDNPINVLIANYEAPAAPVQQVSVPVTGEPSIKCWSCHSVVSLDDRADADGNCPHCRVELDLEEYLRAMLAAAPAAPAADAGLVEALEKLARLGNGDKYGNSDGNLIAQAALAAHRAKGVV